MATKKKESVKVQNKVDTKKVVKKAIKATKATKANTVRKAVNVTVNDCKKCIDLDMLKRSEKALTHEVKSLKLSIVKSGKEYAALLKKYNALQAKYEKHVNGKKVSK